MFHENYIETKCIQLISAGISDLNKHFCYINMKMFFETFSRIFQWLIAYHEYVLYDLCIGYARANRYKYLEWYKRVSKLLGDRII